MKAYLNHIKMTCSHLKAKGLKTDSSSSLEVCIAFQNPFVFPLPKLKSQENKPSGEANIFVFTFILFWTNFGFIALLFLTFLPSTLLCRIENCRFSFQGEIIHQW